MSTTAIDRIASGAFESPWVANLRQRFDLTHPDASPDEPLPFETLSLLHEICDALEAGHLRVAEPTTTGGAWIVHGWVKRALLTLGAAGHISRQPGALPGTELDTLGWIEDRSPTSRVPAGSHLRRGSFLGAGCSVMPPSTVQAGAYIAAGARIDSHVLIGSCAQIGERTVLGCGTMIAGLLLPEPALPVVLEPDVIIGGNSGIYGSVVVGEATVLRPGTIIHSADGLYDATCHEWVLAGPGQPLLIPAHAEIAMGLPPPNHHANDIQRLSPIIIKRDIDTDASPNNSFGGQQ